MTNKNYDEKLAAIAHLLPPAVPALGVYRPFLQVGKRAFVSGHGPYLGNKEFIIGKVGRDLDKDAAKTAARQVGLTILSTLKANLGSLNKIKRVVKVLGMVNATPDFGDHPYVINGCSDLFVEIFGEEHGVGVRSAVGMGSLPDRIPVEIEVEFEMEE